MPQVIIHPVISKWRKNLKLDTLKSSILAVKERGITSSGVITPVIFREFEDGTLQLLAGHRRYFACKELGIDNFPKTILKGLTEKEAYYIAIVENQERMELNVLEEAQAIKDYMKTFNLNKTQVAKEFNKSRRWVAKRLKLLELPEYIQELLIEDKLNSTLGEILAFINAYPDQQKELVNRILTEHLTVNHVRKIAQKIRQGYRFSKISGITTRLNSKISLFDWMKYYIDIIRENLKCIIVNEGEIVFRVKQGYKIKPAGCTIYEDVAKRTAIGLWRPLRFWEEVLEYRSEFKAMQSQIEDMFEHREYNLKVFIEESTKHRDKEKYKLYFLYISPVRLEFSSSAPAKIRCQLNEAQLPHFETKTDIRFLDGKKFNRELIEEVKSSRDKSLVSLGHKMATWIYLLEYRNDFA